MQSQAGPLLAIAMGSTLWDDEEGRTTQPSREITLGDQSGGHVIGQVRVRASLRDQAL